MEQRRGDQETVPGELQGDVRASCWHDSGMIVA